ncbi:EVE domain-containing protein [Naasia aerilata]|uniref:UPF0310 protein n=1 Tax=Naasia aerilata TaxID=1162966 RepID=A0ABM8GER4_9MICO|nr:EVE domain-containing protein [Naasia aerilata]BDZ46823.1 UPF0310 protein [Naasia aerilata]
MSAWLGVVSAEHVRYAVSKGIAQVGHGKRGGLARMRAGDTFVYYSSVERLGDREPLRQFTALGVLPDEEIWQADEGTFHPFRRRVEYAAATPVPLEAVKDRLRLTASPNWGYQLRRGLVPLELEDVEVLRAAMGLRS